MVKQYQQLSFLSHHHQQTHYHSPKNQSLSNRETCKKSKKCLYPQKNGRNFIELSNNAAFIGNKAVSSAANNNSCSKVKGFQRQNNTCRKELGKDLFYAGSNFSSPPAPSSVPLPPLHWRQKDFLIFGPSVQCIEMTFFLKDLLQVQ